MKIGLKGAPGVHFSNGKMSRHLGAFVAKVISVTISQRYRGANDNLYLDRCLLKRVSVERD